MSWKFSDQLGDAYPGDTAQKQEDFAANAPMPMEMDSHEYRFVVAHGQVHVSPVHSHDELIGHAGQNPASDGPTAVGYVNVTNGHATWMVESNMSLRGLHDLLSDYSDTVGWDFEGMVGSGGEHLHDDFGPKMSMWYKQRPDGHLLLAKSPMPNAERIFIEGKIAYHRYVKYAHMQRALEEWAEDFGYKLAAIPPYHPSNYDLTQGSYKGSVDGAGNVLVWPVDNTGSPHHDDMMGDDSFPWQPGPLVGEEGGELNDFLVENGLVWPAHGSAMPLGARQAIAAHNMRFPTQRVLRDAYGPAWKGWTSKTAEYPGGGDMLDTMKNREHLDTFNRGDTDWQPERSNPDVQLGDNLKCGECGRRFDRIEELRLHEQAHQPLDSEEIPDGHFPQIDDFDEPLPFRRRQPTIDWGKAIACMVLPSRTAAARHPRFDLYAELFGFDNDQGHRFYGAYRAGRLVGYATVRLNAEPELVMIDSLEHRSGVGTALMSLIQRHYGSLYTHTDSDMGAALLRRTGFANVRGQFWRWSAMDAPKDMIEDPIPFVYDVHADDIHIGYAGQSTHDVNHRDGGQFTPGGIMEGVYEPGGKVILMGGTTMPLSLYHFGQLWYHRFPQMEITSVEMANDEGKTHKMAAAEIGSQLRALTEGDPAASTAYRALRQAGGKVYVVGGAVRDALQGRNPKDIDLMVGGLPPEQVERVLSSLPGKVKLTGKNFGVYRYAVGNQDVEVALPRTDRYEGERRGQGEITVDHTMPVEKDLERRDFTANSMAVDLDHGNLIDPYGGAQDLEANILRTTHPNSFREDPTRIVRALVAHSRFGLHPDERTRHEMETNAHLIRAESPDALNKIYDKLFASSNPASAIRLAKETGVLAHAFPEVAENWDYDQNNPHHRHTLGDHLVNVLDNVSRETDDPDIRLAALYHDVGKPASAWVKPETGTTHYYQSPNGEGANHEDVGARILQSRMEALNYPRARIDRTVALVQHHMFPAFSTEKGARKFLNRVGPHADDLLTLRRADMTGKGQTPDEVAERTQVGTMKGLVNSVREKGQPTNVQQLPINGNDLIQMGMKPGPQMGQTLQQLTNDVIDDPSLNERNTLLQHAQSYVQDVTSS